jgi:hypothetical protein
MERLKGSSRGVMFTLVTVVVVVLLLGEVLTYLYTNTQYSNLGIQATPSVASGSLYSQVEIGAPAFLQASLTKAVYALNAYETGNGVHGVNSSSYALSSLIDNGTLYGANMVSYMGGYTLSAYANAIGTQASSEGLALSMSGTKAVVFQNSPGRISVSLSAVLNVSSPYGIVSYPVTANASVPISGLPDLFGGSLGTGPIQYSQNISRLVNNSYAQLLSTGSIYNSVNAVGPSIALSKSRSPYLFAYAPLFVDNSVTPFCGDANMIASGRSSYILVAANSQDISSSVCGFAGLITYFSNTVSAPLKPYLVYGYSSGNYVNITLTNSQSSATAVPFQQMIDFNPGSYTSHEATDLGNIRFYQGSQELYSWCESGCNTVSSSNAVFWVKLPNGIAANGNVVVTMAFLSTGTDYQSDGPYAGEAPQLSPTYGQYDNGKSVFGLYDNFSGTSLSALWNPTGNVIVSNGLTITPNSVTFNSAGISSVSTFGYPYWLEGDFISKQSGGPASSLGVEESITNTLPQTGSSGLEYDSGYTMSYGGTTAVATARAQVVSSSGTTTLGGSLASITLPNIGGVAWIATGSQQYQNTYSTFYTGSDSTSSIGPLYFSVLGVGSASFWSGNVQWVRARAYPPNGVMPTQSFNSLQTGLSYLVSNIISSLKTGNTYLLGGGALYDVSPLQGSVYKGAYINSGFSPTYLALIGGQQYAMSPYGVAPLGVATRQVASFSSGGNAVATSIAINTVSGGYNTASFWMQWPTNQVNLVPLSFNAYSIYVTSTAIGFSSASGNMLGTITGGFSGFTTTPWVHVVAEFDNGAPSGDILYIDGVRQNLQYLQGTLPSASVGRTVSMGGFSSSSYNSFNGMIADVQLYNSLLSPYQAYSLYTSGINSGPVNYSSLVGWWPLNGNLNDYSQYHNNATATPSSSVSYSSLTGYGGSALGGGSFYSGLLEGVQGISQCYGISSCAWNGAGKLYVPVPQSYATSSVQLPSNALGFTNNTIPGSAYFNSAQNNYFVASGIPLGSSDTISFWMDWVPVNGNTGDPVYFGGGGGLSGSTGSNFGCSGGGGTIPASSLENHWVNIVAVNGGGSQGLYLNGSYQTGCTLGGPSSSNMVYIGSSSSGTNFFSGSISDVQVYNTVFNSGQIAQLYLNNSVSGASPAGWWPLSSGNNGFTNQTSAVTGNYAVEYNSIGGNPCTEANSLGPGSSCGGVLFLPFGPR